VCGKVGGEPMSDYCSNDWLELPMKQTHPRASGVDFVVRFVRWVFQKCR
jgi:hypothetical protein